ncbi:unnamed protein product [Oppiella nova]|uniref:Protein kinase domain-containing protein n=1 Tax=Oppiella nova TaxID=334625 RepID=A0A7R9LS52_9ACAR|nr:unnamed protein product [Oppiella nova]CAG2166436.1 unnamed protein product [Oppiella nova]
MIDELRVVVNGKISRNWGIQIYVDYCDQTDAGLYESLVLQLLHRDPGAGQYVVQHMDSWFENKEKKDLFYIQMEYCLMDLTTFLSKRYKIFRAGQDWQPMPELEFFVCCQLYLRLVNCLKYIHSNSNVVPVIHSDLHFGNVLLAKFKDKLAVKLADFDLSITINRENNNKDKYCHYDIMNLSFGLTELFDFNNRNPQNYQIVGNQRKADIKAISDDLIDQDRLRNNNFLSYDELVDNMKRWQISEQTDVLASVTRRVSVNQHLSKN